MKKAVPYIFVGALFLLMAFNNLLTRGMFMDGLIYTSIADNMAHGKGTFWDPTYTLTNDVHFRGHPPLMMGMLSLWFRVFGVSMLSAKAYALLVVMLTAALMVALWRRLGYGVRTGWLPLLMCCLISDVVLLSCNNFLESTMCLFVLATVWCSLKGGWWNAAGGVALALAFLVKGPTGLFPLAVPMLVWAFGWKERHFWRMVKETLLLAGCAVASIVLLCVAMPEAEDYLRQYFQTQIVESLGREDRSRTYVIGALFGRSAIVLVMAAAVAVWNTLDKKKTWKIDVQHWRTAGMLMALTLCGSLPMMVSAKQFPHYLLADFPFMALTVATVLEPMAEHYRKYAEGVVAKVVTAVLLVGALVLNITHWQQPGRDKALIEDMDIIMPHLTEGEVVTITDPLVFKYCLHGYYYFYGHVSLDQHEAHRHLLSTAELGQREWEGMYREIPLPTQEYKLYEQK